VTHTSKTAKIRKKGDRPIIQQHIDT